MTLGVLLTIIFMVLKLTHNIDWSWWWVLLPAIIEIGVDALIVMLFGAGAFAIWRKTR